MASSGSGPLGWARTVLLASCWAALTGSALNPATGERQLSLISRDQEIRLGREAAEARIAAIKEGLGA